MQGEPSATSAGRGSDVAGEFFSQRDQSTVLPTRGQPIIRHCPFVTTIQFLGKMGCDKKAYSSRLDQPKREKKYYRTVRLSGGGVAPWRLGWAVCGLDDLRNFVFGCANVSL